jgi:hypothetical protein
MANQETVEAQVMDDFSPLDAPVKQRSYTQHKIYADSDVVPELEEPTFQAPNFSDFDGGSAELRGVQCRHLRAVTFAVMDQLQKRRNFSAGPA